MGATSSAAHRPGPRRKDEGLILSWFRIHTDAVDNPKIQSLPAVLFRFWVNLLCVSQKLHGFLPETSEISFRCRASEKQVSAWLEDLKSRSLIDKTESGQLVMHDWDEHQFVSDSSTERVKKHRAKLKRNVSETHSEQSRADTEQNREPIGQSSSGFEKEKPDKKLNSEKLTTTDEKPKPVYASPKDELAALMLDSMGHRPERGFFVQLCEIIELRGGSVPAYTADMRARIRRLKDPPAEGFFTSQAKKIGGPDVAPIPEPKIEQPKNGHGRCLLCSGVGQTDKGFCSCAMGIDLAVIAARPQKEAS